MHILLYYIPSEQDYGQKTFHDLQEALDFEQEIKEKGGKVTWQ